MAGSNRRIVIVGKTGAGKSSLANTIIGEKLFVVDDTLNSGTKKCEAKEELKAEIVRCITECSPGPHAFLIVLKVEKFTEHEQAVINKVHQYFSEEALKYATILFTHGDQLPEGQTIEEFVRQNENLSDLLSKCGGGCHVIDNKYWKNKPQNEYRSNRFQVKELLKTIDKMVMNNGGWYTNEMLKRVEKKIKQEEDYIRNTSGNMPEQEIREQAKVNVLKILTVLASTAVGVAGVALFAVFFGKSEGMKGPFLAAMEADEPSGASKRAAVAEPDLKKHHCQSQNKLK